MYLVHAIAAIATIGRRLSACCEVGKGKLVHAARRPSKMKATEGVDGSFDAEAAANAVDRVDAWRRFAALSGGNPGILVLARELEEEGHCDVRDLLEFAQAAGLVNNALYVPHRPFGRKSVARTADLIKALRLDPDAERELVRGGQRVPVIKCAIEEMQRDYCADGAARCDDVETTRRP